MQQPKKNIGLLLLALYERGRWFFHTHINVENGQLESRCHPNDWRVAREGPTGRCQLGRLPGGPLPKYSWLLVVSTNVVLLIKAQLFCVANQSYIIIILYDTIIYYISLRFHVLLFHIRSPSPSFTAPEAAKLQVRTSRRMAFWTSTSYWQRGMGGLWLRRVNVWKTSGETRSYDDLHIVDFPCVNVYWRVTFLCFEIVRERENFCN